MRYDPIYPRKRIETTKGSSTKTRLTEWKLSSGISQYNCTKNFSDRKRQTGMTPYGEVVNDTDIALHEKRDGCEQNRHGPY